MAGHRDRDPAGPDRRLRRRVAAPRRDHVKSNGTHAEKVFKLGIKDVAAGETVSLRKKHRFEQRTTRVHYAGTHLLELQVNGQRHGRAAFDVEV